MLPKTKTMSTNKTSDVHRRLSTDIQAPPASQVDNVCCRGSQHTSGLTQTFPWDFCVKNRSPNRLIVLTNKSPALELSTYKTADRASGVDMLGKFTCCAQTQAKQINQNQEGGDRPNRTKKWHPPTHHSCIASKLGHSQFQSLLPLPTIPRISSPPNQLPAFAPFSPVPKTTGHVGQLHNSLTSGFKLSTRPSHSSFGKVKSVCW